jgi:ribosomal-protein-alanine N-acetyltransferase
VDLNGVVIKRATANDIYCIELIERACFDKSERYERSLLHTLVENQEFLTIIACINEKPIGYASAYFSEFCHESKIISIAVLPEYRKRGVGTIMIEEIERNAVAKGIIKVALEVRTTNYEALKFYKKRGFSIRGILLDYYGPGKNAFTMEKFLRYRREGQKDSDDQSSRDSI